MPPPTFEAAPSSSGDEPIAGSDLLSRLFGVADSGMLPTLRAVVSDVSGALIGRSVSMTDSPWSAYAGITGLAQVRISSRAPADFTRLILQLHRHISLKFHEICSPSAHTHTLHTLCIHQAWSDTDRPPRQSSQVHGQVKPTETHFSVILASSSPCQPTRPPCRAGFGPGKDISLKAGKFSAGRSAFTQADF